MNDIMYLILENGTVFEGKSFGADKEVVGEVVFTTAMTGYIETLTDPSYFGQIVVQTFPLIGNYGIISADFESKKPCLEAYIVREWCREPSNFRCEGNLGIFLKENGIPGICGIDTRRLTKIVREAGVMNGMIAKKIPEDFEVIKKYAVTDAVKSVTADKTEVLEGNGKNVVLMDFGAKKNIARSLNKRGCNVITVPSYTTADEIMKFNPDGVMLSNGPGDPKENVEIIEEIKKLCAKKIPLFGICLGHQLLALSQGADTAKLKYGHRGANQPVVYKDGRVFISSQNHGYAVCSETLPDGAEESFKNANDGTNEGIEYSYMPAFSVQFHPEAAAGPLDTSFLFDKFIQMMGGNE
mgnify:FL=1